jgi:hypothetical protein
MNNHQDVVIGNDHRENQKAGMIRLIKHARRFISALCLTALVIPIGVTVAEEPRTGAWSGGAAVGFLGNTPDGTAFATNLHADYFMNNQFSVGPLGQLALTGDLFQIGFSGQGKYWWDVGGIDPRLKANLQAGLGFVHANYLTSDTSFLIPLGVGLDYALNQNVSLISTFLLNLTDLDTGNGNDTNVMPGLTFGVRY